MLEGILFLRTGVAISKIALRPRHHTSHHNTEGDLPNPLTDHGRMSQSRLAELY